MLLKIRNKPEKYKIKILVISTIITMLIITGVWYFLSGVSGEPVRYVADQTEEKVLGANFIFEVFKNFFSVAVDGIVEIKNNI
ncbi:hypothetical protein KKC45_02420 [Patescibacteria group bacterium]|nr:hypothetical protein [Patescibacteria group bacterium]